MNEMKLLTLNTHSLVEQDYERKLHVFADAVAEIRPDVIALQEVSQSITASPVSGELRGFFPLGEDESIRADNHAYRVSELLRERGAEYHWTWLPIKVGYGRYREGVALLSRSPISEAEIVLLSSSDDPLNWKTRKLLGIRTEEYPDEWFYSAHYGWWNDPEEPFSAQWERTLLHLNERERVWLMGDFNSPAQIRGGGYSLTMSSGFHDTYTLAESKDDGTTVSGSIDGWKGSGDAMRIDLILCNRRVKVLSSQVVFNGVNHPVVSDHYGVMTVIERSGI